MKKTLTTALLLTSATFSFGQSIHILYEQTDVTNKTITVPAMMDENVIAELSLQNTTGDKIDYQVNRTIKNPPLAACASLYFCTGVQCYGPSSAVTWTPNDAGSSIGPHAVLPDPNTHPDSLPTYGISAHYEVCPEECNDLQVLYRVYKTASGTSDTAFVTINYSCSTGITEENATLGSLSNAYPNPANNSFTVNYSMPVFSKSEIVLYDLFGKKIMETPLTAKEGKITINTSSLAPGVYFYSLLVNNQTAKSKRLVISE